MQFKSTLLQLRTVISLYVLVKKTNELRNLFPLKHYYHLLY